MMFPAVVNELILSFFFFFYLSKFFFRQIFNEFYPFQVAFEVFPEFFYIFLPELMLLRFFLFRQLALLGFLRQFIYSVHLFFNKHDYLHMVWLQK